MPGLAVFLVFIALPIAVGTTLVARAIRRGARKLPPGESMLISGLASRRGRHGRHR